MVKFRLKYEILWKKSIFLRNNGVIYNYAISGRLGQGTYKEQVAYMYR